MAGAFLYMVWREEERTGAIFGSSSARVYASEASTLKVGACR